MTTDPRVLARALNSADPDAPSEPPPPPTDRWRLGERALRLATVAAAAAAAALVTGRPWLLAVAAGPAVLLALAAPRSRRPVRLGAAVTAEPRRCFEGDTVEARITLDHDGEAGLIDPAITLGPGMRLTELEVVGSVVILRLTAGSWGRWSLGTVDVDLYDTGGLARRTVRAELGTVDVYPVPSAGRLTPIPVRLPERLGEHTTRQSGEGVEVVGVRPHVWGERQRRIHWPSTTRRGSIQINQFAAERTSDAVILLDALTDLRDPASGRSSLDETLRAATGLTRAYLRKHDRVGLVSVGGAVRWLRPGTGDRHFYRLVESVLEVRKDLGYRNPDLHRLPPPALPAGALVYAFTPLADQRILDVLRDLADRGNPLVVVEIPTGDPHVEPDDRIGATALRLWQADRRAMRFALQNRGIPVVTHTAGESLDLTLAPLLRSRIQGRAR
ncbi:uncharacterized protein (DUF58 family) [Kitasatospora sp. MAP12-15]|uniref:DUF58 domain-containing protein n=1 Tax=unclassified Kitasatospora TaxID=2633591 RepID=UPI002475864F|nr:DUF58 domain-containing protein [Kitasatospora sp. MAP12-44]MDH6113905.1 uncharacterized protein (DUF58 family) [Kitasatospora sp. MAP12-44]